MRVIPLLRSPGAAARWIVLMLLPFALTLASPLLAPYAILLIYYLAPLCVCLTAVLGGLVPMLAGVVACMMTLHRLFGLTGALMGCLYLAPVAAAFAVVFALRLPFLRAAAVAAAAMFLSQLAVFLILQSMTGGRMYEAAGDAVAAYVAGSESCDALLVTLYQSGLIGAAGELSGDMLIEAIGGFTLTDAARADFLLSLSTAVRTLLSAFVPGALVSQSVYTGVGAVALGVRLGRVAWQRKAFKRSDGETEKFPDLGMPPLAKWHLPRGWGLRVGVLAVGYPLMALGGGTLALAGALMYAAFSAVYAVQGVAFVNFVQHKRDSKRGWRIAAPLLLFLLARQALVILGVVDQISGARGLRPPIQRNQRKDDDLL